MSKPPQLTRSLTNAVAIQKTLYEARNACSARGLQRGQFVV